MCNNRPRGHAAASMLFGIATAFSVSAFAPLVAHEGQDDHNHPPIKLEPAKIYRPTAIPDRVIVTWPADPKTSFAVNWRTDTSVDKPLAEIVVADHGPNFPQRARRVTAESCELTTDINTARFHNATFSDLEPGQKYTYRVGDGENWSEWHQYRTEPAKAEPFSFVYFGDAQNSVRSMWSRVIREAYRDAPRAAFMLHAGDLINSAEADAEWGEWFAAGGWANATTANIAAPGNHEQARQLDGTRRLSHHWRPQFSFPTNGPDLLPETCYTTTYGDLRIIILDSNREIAIQRDWLDAVLAANRHRWVVCSFHHPIFSAGKERDNPELRKAWKPVFDKYRVDLVLQGHDHTYARSNFSVPSVGQSLADQTVANVATGVQKMDEDAGTIYVVSVSGPKMYDNQEDAFVQRVAEDTQLYQIIHIDGDTLTFESRTARGELYDAFRLLKQPGTRNKLEELPVEVDLRLR